MAEVDVLFTGYVGRRVAGTVSLVRDDGLVAVVDPGMVPEQAAIVQPLEVLGIGPEQVTDVVLSHHHPDHTMNVGLFPGAHVHDHWAVYHHDVWEDRPAEGARLSTDVHLIETPGHTPQDITTLVETPSGTVALTHLWWNVEIEGDPRAWSVEQLHANRRRVLDLAIRIVPGHGPMFHADDAPA